MQEELEELIKRHGAAKFIKFAHLAMKENQDMRETSKIEDVCLDVLSQSARVVKREEKREAERNEDNED